MHTIDHSKKWIAHAGISILAFTGFLDFTIVNTALPAIQSAIGANIIQLQWVMNIYALVLCMCMVVMGRLGDLFGQRLVLYIGVIVFGAASLGAGFANSPNWLIFFRFCQGIGGAVIFPVAAAILPQMFPEEEKAKAFGVYGSITGLGLALGPVLGGILVTYISWRAVFFINIPIMLLGFLICAKTVPEVPKLHTKIHIDWLGWVLLILGVGGFVYAIISSEVHGWTAHTTLLAFAVSIVSLIALYRFETRQETPLLDFELFKNPTFLTGVISIVVGGGLSCMALFFDPLYLITIRNESAVTAGAMLIAIPLMCVFFSPLMGFFVGRFGMYKTVLLGLVLGAISAIMHAMIRADTSPVLVLVPFIFVGLTWAISNTMSTICAQSAVTPDKVGAATGTMFTMFNVSSATMLAMGVVFFHSFERTSLMAGLKKSHLVLQPNQQHSIKVLLSDPVKAKSILNQFGILLHDKILALFKTAFMTGYSVAMWFGFIVAVLCCIACYFLMRAAKP